MEFQVGTAVASKPAPLLGTLTLAPAPAQLPAVAGARPTTQQFRRVDEVMSALDTQMNGATNRVGVKSPVIENVRDKGSLIVIGTTIATGIAVGLAGVFAWDWGYVGPAVAAAAIAIPGSWVTNTIWSFGCDIASKRRASQPPASKDLDGLRGIVQRPATATEAAGLGKSAEQWLTTLDNRHVHGFDAQEMLGELKAHATKATNAETIQVARWVALRSAIASCVGADELKSTHVSALRDAFDELPLDEQRDIAPVVLEKLFKDEAPIHPGWDFTEGFGLNERLNRIAAGLPVPDDRTPKAKKKAPEPAGAEDVAERDGEPVSAAPEPAPVQTTAISTEDSTTIASLDGTVKAFEAALAPALKLPKKKLSVLPADLAAAVAIAQSAERTPVELVALGARASRVVDELNSRGVYGYQARQKLLDIAKAAEQLSPELRDQIGRIDVYRAAIDAVAPKALDTAAIDRVMSSVDGLLPCDQRMGAQRAYDRYFENGVPRHAVDYSEGQRFLKALRSYIKKV